MDTPSNDDPPKDDPEAKPPAKNKEGAPVGSQNAFRHGLKGGKLPKGLQYIEKRANLFRLELEGAVIAAKGEISLTDAACINSAMRWERHAMLAADWLRKEGANLSPADRLRFSSEIAKAGDNRDKNIRLLELDKKPEPPSLVDFLAQRKVTDV